MIRQVFCEAGSWPVCASCAAEFRADGDLLVMLHAPGCSQVAAITAQAGAA